MSVCGKYNKEELNDLLHVKGQEWQNIVQQHIDALVKELDERDESIVLEKTRFKKLKEDFEYNLNLIKERDEDLQKYEELFEQLKGNDNLNNQQVSEMKIKIDEFQMKFNLLQKEKEEMQHHYQARLKHYQEEVNMFYSKKEEEHQKVRNEYEDLKRSLQRKIADTEQEVEFERQRLLKEMGEAIKLKENEYHIKLDKRDAEIHSYHLKVKALSHELHVACSSNTEATESAESNRGTAIQLGKLLKEKEWEIEDMKHTKDLKVKELELKIEDYEKNMKWKTEEFERKYREVEKVSNERESILRNLREAADHNEKKLCDDIRSIQQQKEEIELSSKKLQWDMSDKQLGMEKEIEKVREQMECLERKLKEEMETGNKTIVAKDVELEALKSSEDHLRKDANKLKSSVDRLKKDLALAMDRERILENAKVQLELDWRRRYETKESDIYEKHDDLVRNLSKEKEDTLETLKQREAELNRRENLIKLLEDDKEIAVKCLKENGINTDHLFTDRIPERESEEGRRMSDSRELEIQNKQLRDVIKEMRSEMEMLSQQAASSTSTPNKAVEEKSNYVKELELEIQDLKASNRQLLVKMEDLTRDEKPPQPGMVGKVNMKEIDVGVRNYIKELNAAIGTLKNDKVLLSASINSKDVTVNHLNETITRLTNEKQQQVLEIDKLKYDTSSKCQVYEHSISALKQRISELELLLQQSRSEAEIYYKSVVERNSDTAQVNNKLSDLKLQQSILPSMQYGPPPTDTKSVLFYKEKLKLAVERIKELSIERMQLINMGNKFRAQVANLKEGLQVNNEKSDTARSSNMRYYGDKMQSKLDQLQQLKYDVITDELKKETKRKEMDVDVILSSLDMSEIPGDIGADDTSLIKDNGKENVSDFHTSSEHSSVKEIWKLLEKGDVSSLPDNTEDGHASEELTLVGQHIEPDKKTASAKTPALKSRKTGKLKNRPKVRNYNKKGDD